MDVLSGVFLNVFDEVLSDVFLYVFLDVVDFLKT